MIYVRSENQRMMSDTQQLDVSNELCNSVFNVNDKITYVGIINQKGRIENCRSRNSIIEKFPDTKKEMFLMENALWDRIKIEYDDYLGQVQYTYVRRKKREVLSFPMGNSLLLVSFKQHLDVSLLAKIITRLINKYKKKLNHFA